MKKSKNNVFISLIFSLMAVLCFVQASYADIFYAVSNYATGAAGVLSRNGEDFRVGKDVVVGLGRDAYGFTFQDHNGEYRALIREYQYGPNDSVYIWDPANWNTPIVNANRFRTNIHCVRNYGKHLYLSTYESYEPGDYAQNTGEVIKVDMSGGYAVEKIYRYERFNNAFGLPCDPHAEGIQLYKDKLYVLYAISYNGVAQYEPSEVVEFDLDLNPTGRKAKVGKNASGLAIYKNKLYVPCMGGYQGPDTWGDLWSVDIENNLEAKKLIDGKEDFYKPRASVCLYGITFAGDGTAYLLTGSYSQGFGAFVGNIYKTSAEELEIGYPGDEIASYENAGYSWKVLWDEKKETLWCMVGKALEARNKDGSLVRTFTPRELGDNIYSISLIDDPDMSYDTSTKKGVPVESLKLTPLANPLDSSCKKTGYAALADRDELAEKMGIPALRLYPDGENIKLEDKTYRKAAQALWGTEIEKENKKLEKIHALPVFETKGTSGALISSWFEIKGSQLYSERAEGVKITKVYADDRTADKYTPALSLSEVADGKFLILDSSDTPVSEIEYDKTYKLGLYIQDGGNFDLDKKVNGAVLDPAIILQTADKPLPPVQGGAEAGSTGGCSATGNHFSLLLLFLPLLILLKKNRAGDLLLLLLLFSALAIPQPSYAVTSLPEEIVSAEAEEESDLSPGAVTVIRTEDFKGEQKTLPDMLENVPGLRVIRLQGRHGYSVASVRGSTSAQVAVYIDGVLANLQSEPAVDLSAIPADMIERIEVYKGYIPARFGAQAMGGVINIITKMPEEKKTNLLIGYGSFGRKKANASHSAKLFGGKFFAGGTYEGYDGDFDYWNDNGTPYDTTDNYEGTRRENGFENGDLLIKWENESWKAKASWVKQNRDLALVAPGLDKPGIPQRPSAIQELEKWDMALSRRQQSGKLEWGIKLTYVDQQKDYDSRRGSAPSEIGGSYITKSRYNTDRFGVAIDGTYALGERHLIEALGEFYNEKLHVKGDNLYTYLHGIEKYSRQDSNLTLQDTISLDKEGTLTLVPSVRWHEMDKIDHTTWQVGVNKEFSPRLSLKSTYGTYARAPNLYEEYGDGAFILPASEGLVWETGKQFDIGLHWKSEYKSIKNRISLTGFWRETDNLIEFDMESPAYGRYKNIAKAEVKGIELETGFRWKSWLLELTGTWMEGENKTPDDGSSVRYNGKSLPNRPEWSGTARLTKNWKNISGFGEVIYTGKNYADPSEKVIFEARAVCNAGIKYKLGDSSRLSFGVNDIFNQADDWRMRPDGYNGPTRMLWYPMEGRNYYITYEIEF